MSVTDMHHQAQNRNWRGPSFASRFFSVRQFARDFTDVVDNITSSHSKLSFLIWGIVRMTTLVKDALLPRVKRLMILACKSVTYYETFSEILLKIGRHCPSSQVYYRVYRNSSTLERSLCNFFASLIQCCKQVVEAVRRARM